MNRPVILCVDDEKIILDSLKAQLKKEFGSRFDLETAESGEEALEIIEELIEDRIEIPLIISDHIMPNMQGDQLLINVHKILPDTLKILLTGQTTSEAIVNAVNQAKLYRFIAKPWDETDLLLTAREAVQCFIDHKKLENQNKQLNKLVHDLKSINTDLKDKVKEVTEAHRETNWLMGELQEEKRRADLLNETKTRFLANMSHEIRSPLNAIVGFSQIMTNQSHKLNLPLNFQENLFHIATSGQNLSELINNILDLSKIESGKIEVVQESINFKLLFQGIYHVNKGSIQEKKINFNYNFDPSIPDYIESDRSKLNQILMNLISNAIKFTPSFKKVTMHATNEGESILIKVEDEGIGIPKEKISKIFESFEQVDNTETRKFGGSGLGLTITKRMIEMLKGTITFESEEGKGSVFYVRIPLVKAQTESESNYTEEINLLNYSFAPDNVILVVEDIEMNRKMMKALFEELNLEINFAVNGIEGVAQTKALKPDLVLMDMNMPEMDGMEATKIIREIPEFKNTPIIALSADAFIEQQNRALEIGITHYLTKPIDLPKLMPFLSKYLKHNDMPFVAPSALNKELPLHLINEVIERFNIVHKTPKLNFEEIDSQVSKMKEICKGYQTPYIQLINDLDDALFTGNLEQIEKTIAKALDYSPTNVH